MMTVAEIAPAADNSRWRMYNSWATMRSVRAQLDSDVASHADPAVISSDRASLAQKAQQFVYHRDAHIDVTV